MRLRDHCRRSTRRRSTRIEKATASKIASLKVTTLLWFFKSGTWRERRTPMAMVDGDPSGRWKSVVLCLLLFSVKHLCGIARVKLTIPAALASGPIAVRPATRDRSPFCRRPSFRVRSVCCAAHSAEVGEEGLEVEAVSKGRSGIEPGLRHPRHKLTPRSN